MESTTRSQKQNERCGVAGTQLGLLWLWLTTVTQEFDNVRKIIVLQPNLLSIVGVEYNRACNSSSGRKHIKRNEDTNRLETMPRVKCGMFSVIVFFMFAVDGFEMCSVPNSFPWLALTVLIFRARDRSGNL